jgi:acyl carrier protein
VTAATAQDTVRRIIAEQLGIDPALLKLEHKLQDDLGADSLDNIEIVMALEEAFGIALPDEEIEPALVQNTVGALADYVAGKVRQ